MVNSGSLTDQITKKLKASLEPEHLELANESHMHAGPATDSHFNLLLVSQLFVDMTKVQRHQAVYKILADELAGPVHALVLHFFSPAEWHNSAKAFQASPDCEGKNI